jgi:hypothetical protein
MESFYEYDVGNLVQLVRGGKVWMVKWRSYILVRRSGIWVREPVYRLDNGYWDCYYEDELHVAWRWYEA